MSVPDRGVIERALADAGHEGVAVHAFDELPSTNAWLSQAPPGGDALCIADSQVRGAGRRGRGWRSRPGDLTFSVRRRFSSPPARLAPLALVTGISVARTLREITSLDVLLKWPNDLLLAGSKLGGLLVEARAGAVVGGIGINLLPTPADGTSLGDFGVPAHARDRLAGTIAARLLGDWARFDGEGWSVYAEAWQALDALHGRAVSVHEGAPLVGARIPSAASWSGVARGLEADGALRVERADGTVRSVHAGDVSVRASP